MKIDVLYVIPSHGPEISIFTPEMGGEEMLDVLARMHREQDISDRYRIFRTIDYLTGNGLTVGLLLTGGKRFINAIREYTVHPGWLNIGSVLFDADSDWLNVHLMDQVTDLPADEYSIVPSMLGTSEPASPSYNWRFYTDGNHSINGLAPYLCRVWKSRFWNVILAHEDDNTRASFRTSWDYINTPHFNAYMNSVDAE